MKARAALPAACLLLCALTGCASSGSESGLWPAPPEEAAKQEQPAVSSASPDGEDLAGYHLEYPYSIAADRTERDLRHPDIIVGDRLFMTQINDWYRNFSDYEGKLVEIEGYFLFFDVTPEDRCFFVGRNGPSCPYCTGGYVDVQFQTDQDLSAFTSGRTWISVTGILREGTEHLPSGEDRPMYYIEALDVHMMPRTGMETVAD